MRYVIALFAGMFLLLATACSSSDQDEPSVEAAVDETPTPEATATPSPPAELSWEEIVDVMEPSTVMIRADFPETVVSYEGQGAGTGIVYSEDGYILTNAHVVSGAAALTVSSSGSSRQRSARFVGVSACDDLAVIQVTDMDGLQPATFGDSSALRTGNEVASLGYPLGEFLSLDISFSRGVIGQMNDTQWHYERLIQHDARISPGNSGGPLVNRQGEVIGINTLALNPEFAQSMFWAIDINQAKPIMSELEAGNNRLSHGMNLVPNIYADYFGTEEGLVVAAVASGSSASTVGVEPAFLLTHLEGLTINTMEDVCRVLRSQNEGDSVSVQFMNVTASGVEILEGAIVLGGSGGQALEVVYSEGVTAESTASAADEASEQDQGVEQVEEPGTSSTVPNGQIDPDAPLIPSIWSGVATVDVRYWAPCGDNGAWIKYDDQTWMMDTVMLLDVPFPQESNSVWMEIYTAEEEEGGFWLLSSWLYDNGDMAEYWSLDLGGSLSGSMNYMPMASHEVGNVFYSYLPVDPCSDELGYELTELLIDPETILAGGFDGNMAAFQISGLTNDLYRDFDIFIDFQRIQ